MRPYLLLALVLAGVILAAPGLADAAVGAQALVGVQTPAPVPGIAYVGVTVLWEGNLLRVYNTCAVAQVAGVGAVRCVPPVGVGAPTAPPTVTQACRYQWVGTTLLVSACIVA